MIIPKAELANRWKNTQQLMSHDALLLPLGVNFQYYFDKQSTPSERLIAGILPKAGDPFILCPTFEQENMQRSTGIDDVVTWDETQSPYKILAQELKNRQLGSNIGVDPKLWIIEVERLQAADSTLQISAAGDVIEKNRRHKSEWEIQQQRLAAQYTAEGIYATIDRLQEGMTEREVIPILQKELGDRSGQPLSFGIVQFGANSAIPHGYPTDKKLRHNELVLLDVGTSYNGYHGDITITIPFGTASDEFKKVYDIVYEANRAALTAEHVGMYAGDLDAVARTYIDQKGYGKYFTHRLGHGIGIEVHEPPYLVGNSTVPLATGDTHSNEPGIYMLGKFGVRIEDDVVLTKNGPELLFNTPRYVWK